MKTKLIKLSIVSVALVLGSSCSIITGKAQGQNQKIYASPDQDPNAQTVGTQNFLQVKASMEKATNVVTTSDTTVNSTYTTSISQLSGDGSANSVSAASLTATTTLASAYCTKAVANERAAPSAGVLFTAVDFTQGPTGLSDSVLSSVAASLAKRFWGRPASSTETAALVSLMKDTLSNVSKTFTSVAGTSRTLSASQQVDAALMIGCTAAGGSLDFVRS